MGNCERCRKEIPIERLEILPDTRLCVRCSSEIGGDCDLVIVEENLGDSIISEPVIQKLKKWIEPLSDQELDNR